MQVKVIISWVLIFVLQCGLSSKSKAQSIQQIDALNYYMEFVNTSSHGLGIALLIAEGLNCDVIEAKGEECEQQVRITVGDIPSNLFDVPDDNSIFYKITPIELSQIAEKESVILDSEVASTLNKKTERAVFILNEVNRLIYKLSSLKETSNFKKKKASEAYYKELQTLEKLFKQFREVKAEIVDMIFKSFPSPESKLYPVLFQYRNCATEILEDVLQGELRPDSKTMDNYTLVSENVLSTLNSIKDAIGKEYPKFNEQIFEFENKTEFFNKLIETYHMERASKSVQAQESLNNLYYNRMCKLTFNQTGPGIVTIFKEILNFLSIKGINFDEQIVSFKVLYPTK